MQLISHPPLQRIKNHSVLLNPVLADKLGADHMRGKVIPISGKVLDSDLRIWKNLLYQAFNFTGFHSHGDVVLLV